MWNDEDLSSVYLCVLYCSLISRHRKLEIYRAPTKDKLWKPAYSQALNQNKIDTRFDRQRTKIQRVRQAHCQTAMVF